MALLKIYDPNTLVERKLERMMQDYDAFHTAATSEDNSSKLLQAIKKVAPETELVEVDLFPLKYYDRSDSESSKKLAEKYGFEFFDFESVPDISFYIPNEVWIETRKKLKFPGGIAGAFFPKIFLGDQTSFPTAICSETLGEDSWYNEFKFVYYLFNGIHLGDKSIISPLHSLHYEANEGRRSWKENLENAKSVKEVGKGYFSEEEEKLYEQWQEACDSLRTLDEISEKEGLQLHLAELVLLRADSLGSIIGYAERVEKEDHGNIIGELFDSLK